MEANVVVPWLATLLTVLLISRQVSRAVWLLVGRPYVVAQSLGRQGIRGPPYKFAVGSLPECRRLLISGRANGLDAGSHNYTSMVQPFFHKWSSDYGKTFLYWLGPVPSICSTDIELVKEVLTDRTNLFQKDYVNPSFEVILGKGVIFANGDDWKRRHRVVLPLFNHEKLKSMPALVSECTRQMMEGWSAQIEKNNGRQAETETDIRRESEELILGILEIVLFGGKHKETREVLVAGKELHELAVHAMLVPPVPGFRYLPTRLNRRSWKLDKFVRSQIMQMIRTRLAIGEYGEDMLGRMLQACRTSDVRTLTLEEIIGECKTIYAAGLDTTANFLTWVMFLLSSYPEWQEKVREEVLRECSEEVPSIDSLGKLKLLNMTLLETLRLYNPVPFILRRTASDTTLANIKVPKGTAITIPISMLHRDKEVWGADSDDFNPLRFENGISRAAKYANSLLAFSYGLRVFFFFETRQGAGGA